MGNGVEGLADVEAEDDKLFDEKRRVRSADGLWKRGRGACLSCIDDRRDEDRCLLSSVRGADTQLTLR